MLSLYYIKKILENCSIVAQMNKFQTIKFEIT